MRGAILTLVLGLACAAAAASGEAGTSRALLNYGDSLAVGTGLFIRPLLAGWSVHDDASVGRHADEADADLRGYGSSLPRVIAVSLGANDRPGRRSSFRRHVLDVLDIAGPDRCVIWSTIVRPPYRGVSYAGLNTVLRDLDRRSEVLRVFDWEALARTHPAWFVRDGVHPTMTGYRTRAEEIARLARSCS
jgi:lysophospholipase L1-like esterase